MATRKKYLIGISLQDDNLNVTVKINNNEEAWGAAIALVRALQANKYFLSMFLDVLKDALLNRNDVPELKYPNNK